METKRTEMTKHYWNNEGAYDKEFTELTNKLMPAVGRGANLRAEVVRAANRLYYEYCNNGNCNAIEVKEGESVEIDCPSCGGCGYYGDDEDDICEECGGSGVAYEDGEEETEFVEYWHNFAKIIRYAFRNNATKGFDSDAAIKAVCEVEDFIEQSYSSCEHSWYFNDKNMHRYDLMIDFVYEWAVMNDNLTEPIPDWYKNDLK